MNQEAPSGYAVLDNWPVPCLAGRPPVIPSELIVLVLV
jgi:hypothetical protein